MTKSDYQLFGPLDPVKEAALRASIERFGVLVPVAVDQHGNVIDGHHRKRIADELGVEYRTDVHVVHDGQEAEEIAATLNAVRRQLTPEERRPVVVDLHERGHSNRAIAAALGVSEITVRRDLSGATCDAPEYVLGKDGKSYPRKQTTHAFDLKTHPICDLFPWDESAVEDLTASIATNGLLMPITLCEGLILDGKLRYEACRRAGVEPHFDDYEDYTNPPGETPGRHAWVVNTCRKGVEPEERAALDAEIEALEAKWRGGERR